MDGGIQRFSMFVTWNPILGAAGLGSEGPHFPRNRKLHSSAFRQMELFSFLF